MRTLFVLTLFALFRTSSFAQCVNTYPYVQDFEASAGGWVSGGTGNDWAWGTPAKAVISSAGSGTRAWITGGLTASFYNLGARSFVESPCFDFTNLQYPFISLKVFWESERTFDGSNIQYSTNGGTTWQNVGSLNDPVDCLNFNWYNTPNITNLATLATVREGWAGNIQQTQGSCLGGSGSTGWVVARHCMPNLAGVPQVKFRVTFGAGTACNNYDGFAFDSVAIGNAPPNTADFSYICNGNTVTFTGFTSLCPNSFQWNFGDPASGNQNTANTANASHTFSQPGTYVVSYTVAGPCNAPATVTKTIRIIQASAASSPVSCFGANDGKAWVTPTGNVSNLLYTWNTSPVQTTDTAFNLAPGTYQVTVSATGEHCPATASVTVQDAVSINVQTQVTGDTCSQSTGAVAATVSGGVPPFQFSWSNGGNGPSIQSLTAGIYTVTATDSRGCTATASAVVPSSSGISINQNSLVNVSCAGGSDGSISVTVIGGTAPVSISWSGNGGSTNAITGLTAGGYTVSVTDAAGCSSSASYTITEPLAVVAQAAIQNATCGIDNGSVTLTVNGGTPPYAYAWNSGANAASISNVAPGSYTYTVTDSNGCTTTGQAVVLPGTDLVVSVISREDTCATGKGAAQVNVANGTPPFQVVWSNGSSGTTVNLLLAGAYSYTVTDAAGCSLSNTLAISNIGEPVVIAPMVDTFICFAVPITYSPGVFNAYQWSGGESAASVTLAQTGSYQVTVQNADGCRASQLIRVKENCASYIYFPTGFSPNGDGSNDVFRPRYSSDLVQYALQVYNRWGELVFATTDVNEGWDGLHKATEQPLGVFVWVATVTFRGQKPERMAGNVTLMR